MRLLRPAVFIDKDGTLVENVPWNVDPARLRFHTGALASLAALAQAGFALVIVTNQAGLAEGRFTRPEFDALARVLERRLALEAGVRLAGFECCPHAPGADGRPACRCRKPAPGMLIDAAQSHGLDLARSWMVGDTLDDVEAGHRAGCRSILLDTGGETVWRRGPGRVPEVQASEWDEVAHTILAQRMRTLPWQAAWRAA